MFRETINVALSVSVFASAILCILADRRNDRRRVYVFKPLTMVLVLAIAAQSGAATDPFYARALLLGLVFSLAGDIFLMLPDDRFEAGLGSFLVGHLCYIVAFASDVGFGGPLAAGIPFLVGGAIVLILVLPGVGRERPAVFAYVAVIATMGWQAASRWLALGDLAAGLACTGAVLFVFSDAVLALNRFRTPFAAAQPLVLGSYFTAQWLIALSIGVGGVLFGSSR